MMGKFVKGMRGKTRVRTSAFDGVFEWSPTAQPDWEGRFTRAQAAVDSAVLRYSAPYVPFETGTLNGSGVLGTKIGSGEVIWNAPYARFLYYGNVMVGVNSGSPWAKKGERKKVTERELEYHGGGKRGKLWFERMKVDHKQDILDEARGAMRK